MSGVGQRLKEARRAKGLSLADVEEATKVRAKYLDALENEDADALPEEAYARGFLKAYAELVELDANELLRQYRMERGAPRSSYLPEPMEELERDDAHVPRRGIIVVVAVVAIGLLLWIGLGLAGAMNPAGETQENGATTKEATSSADKPTVKPPEGKIIIAVAPVGAALPYVEVTVDGRIAWEGLLDRSREFTGQKIKLRSTSAEEIEITRDGKPVTIPEDEAQADDVFEETFIAR